MFFSKIVIKMVNGGKIMKKIAFYDTKPYDKVCFDKLNDNRHKIKYFENKLTTETAILANGCEGVIAFVNDTISKEVIEKLVANGTKVLAMRCAGYNNVDFKSAYEKLTILRVPSYSPYAIAEHAIGMILTLNRKFHKAYNRTRENNFSLNGLTGFDLNGKTVGVIGTGNIGQIFIDIAKGFNMKVLAFDPYPLKSSDISYVSLEELFAQSDIISLHCPLTKKTKHIINQNAIKKMKHGVFIINTSRGALIESKALLHGLQIGKIGAAGLDVYEEEAEWFFEDHSDTTNQDEILSLLVAQPNVLITSHQAFLTNEALENIAQTTLQNLDDYFEGRALQNEICYRCLQNPSNCEKKNGRCF